MVGPQQLQAENLECEWNQIFNYILPRITEFKILLTTKTCHETTLRVRSL